MKRLTLILRILLGLVFLFAGVSYFFMPPPPVEGAMGEFIKGMEASKYFFYLLKGTEAICGLLLLSGQLVPLALIVLAPVILNIFLVNLSTVP